MKQWSLNFLWIFFLCIFAACQQKTDSEVNSEMVYQAEKIIWEEDIQPENIKALYYQNDRVYMVGDQEKEIWLYTMNTDGTKQQKKKIKMESSSKNIEQIVTDGSGNYGMILSQFMLTQEGNGYNQYFYALYRENGDKLKQVMIQELENSETILSIDIDGKHLLIVYHYGSAEIYNISLEDEDFNINKSNHYSITYSNNSYVMLDGKDLWIFSNQKAQKWDIDKRKKILEFEVNISSSLSDAVYIEQGKYSVYIMDKEGIFGCSKDGSLELLMEWLSNDINGNRITVFDGEDEVFFAGSIEGIVYRIMKKEKKTVTEEREVITVATTETVTNIEWIWTWMEEFNRSQNKYLIRLMAYGKYDNPEERLRLDVISGKGPDVIMSDLEKGNMMELLDKRDGLEDLYNYMDRDPEISKEDFIENALKLLETEGKLTKIADNFTIHALIGKKDFVGDRKSWTWEEFAKYCEEIPENEYAFIGSKDDLFDQAFSSIYPQFFNLSTGKIFMEEGNFLECKSLSEKICGYPSLKNLQETVKQRIEKVKKGDIYVCSYSMYGLPFVLQSAYGKIGNEEELALIGYPSDSGTGVSMSFGNQYAITSFSEHKEGAWQFLKSILTADNMYTCTSGSLPLRKDCYEFNKKCMTAKEDYIDENGMTVTALGVINNCIVSEEDIQMVEQMIELADCRTLPQNHPLQEIVEQELWEYEQEEERTLQETAEHIESRVNIYFSEQE